MSIPGWKPRSLLFHVGDFVDFRGQEYVITDITNPLGFNEYSLLDLNTGARTSSAGSTQMQHLSNKINILDIFNKKSPQPDLPSSPTFSDEDLYDIASQVEIITDGVDNEPDINAEENQIIKEVTNLLSGSETQNESPLPLDMDFEVSFDDMVDMVPSTEVTDEAETESILENKENVRDIGEQGEPSRFIEMTEQEMEQFRLNQKAKSTTRKTDGHVKLFCEFLKLKGENIEFHEIEVSELSKLLGNFIVSLRKKREVAGTGNEYQPSYLRGIFSSLDRHLREKHYRFSLIRDKEFSWAREMLGSKMRDLKGKGLGNRPMRARTLLPSEVEILWEKGALGMSTPQTLVNTLWWYNSTEFGMRGGAAEHRSLCWGDVTLKTATNGRKYLEFNERQSKMRMGDHNGGKGGSRAVNPMIFEDKDLPNRCPVKAYELYAKMRPINMMNETSPFYLQPKFFRDDAAMKRSKYWFKNQVMGIKSIGNIMKLMSQKADLSDSKRLTNTSARKYLLNTLRKAHVPPTDIIQKSGHKNIASIVSYGEIMEDDQEAMGNLIRGKQKTYNGAQMAVEHNCREDNEGHNMFALPSTQSHGTSSSLLPGNPPVMPSISSSSSVGFAQSTQMAQAQAPLSQMFSGTVINGGSFNFVFHLGK